MRAARYTFVLLFFSFCASSQNTACHGTSRNSSAASCVGASGVFVEVRLQGYHGQIAFQKAPSVLRLIACRVRRQHNKCAICMWLIAPMAAYDQ